MRCKARSGGSNLGYPATPAGLPQRTPSPEQRRAVISVGYLDCVKEFNGGGLLNISSPAIELIFNCSAEVFKDYIYLYLDIVIRFSQCEVAI